MFKPKILTDVDGNRFILNEKGQKLEVIVNEFGEECVYDENGYLVPID